jgi:hypothetical protein
MPSEPGVSFGVASPLPSVKWPLPSLSSKRSGPLF